MFSNCVKANFLVTLENNKIKIESFKNFKCIKILNDPGFAMDFKVKVVTWNSGTAAPPANTLPGDLEELLQPVDADLIVLNLQEVTKAKIV